MPRKETAELSFIGAFYCLRWRTGECLSRLVRFRDCAIIGWVISTPASKTTGFGCQAPSLGTTIALFNTFTLPETPQEAAVL